MSARRSTKVRGLRQRNRELRADVRWGLHTALNAAGIAEDSGEDSEETHEVVDDVERRAKRHNMPDVLKRVAEVRATMQEREQEDPRDVG